VNRIKCEIIFDGKNSDVVIGMYIDSRLIDDVAQEGWNLSGCDDKKYDELIGDCLIVSSYVEKEKAGVLLALSGSDKILVEKTIKGLVENLDYLIRPTLLGLRSRTPDKYDFSIKNSTVDFE
jgi:hypothetical protein